MPDLISLALALLPILAYVALIVETYRSGTGHRPEPGADLRYRAYSA